MPRFFFNVTDGIDIVDHEGVELADLPAARLQAVHYSGELLKDHPDTLWVGHEWRIDVTDAARHILFSIHISAVDAPALKDWKPSGATID